MDQAHDENAQGSVSAPDQPGGIKGFFIKYGSVIAMTAVVGYMVLLGIGVFAEIFKIQWILDWWIWSPPGKFK